MQADRPPSIVHGLIASSIELATYPGCLELPSLEEEEETAAPNACTARQRCAFALCIFLILLCPISTLFQV